MVGALIRGDKGQLLDANADIQGGTITLHSRGGTGPDARNSEYSLALVAILDRLLTAGEMATVLLDSAPAKQFSKVDRKLVSKTEFLGPVEELASVIRRRMRDFGKPPTERGGPGNSQKRIRIETDLADAKLRELVKAVPHAASPGKLRLPAEQLRKVRSSHVHRAVERMLAGEKAPNFANSRDYDLLTPGGHRFPPKKVFGRRWKKH
jgi:hypothetical protein